MALPRLSIITPSYNQVDFLEQNLRSVRSQSDENVEHIVVDGGSTDGTVELLREYEGTYNLQWVSESDRGQTHALNKGIEMATGNWVGWQNSDDFYIVGAFVRLASAIEANPDADVVYGDLRIVDESGDVLAKQFMTRPSKFLQRYWSLFASNQSLFVRADVLDDIAPLDEELVYTMDADLTWKLLDGEYTLVHVPEELGAFRVQRDAKTFGDVSDKQRSELDEIYNHPWYETWAPRPALKVAAKGLKFALLLREGRTDALKHNLLSR